MTILSITCLETSSNYIEEQGPGVFPKTLRNMWFVVSLFNPCKLNIFNSRNSLFIY
jgi:hypothetical protein